MTDEPIVLQTPVAAVVNNTAPAPRNDKKFDLIVRLFSWLTAAFLSAAIVVALVVGSIERDTLREEVNGQTAEQLCRDIAGDVVEDAERARDTTIAKALVALNNGNDAEVDRLVLILAEDTERVNAAEEAEQKALEVCASK